MTRPPIPFTRGKKASRRDQILAAAAALFAQRGFHGVGIDDIGAAVGISGPALYRHFRGKDAILGEMLGSISEFLLAGGTERAGAHPDPQQALSELVSFHVDFAIKHPALITAQERNFTHLTDTDRSRVRNLQRRYIQVWVDTIQRAVPGISSSNARRSAHAVFGLINSTPHGRDLNEDGLPALLARLALGALRAAG